LITTVPDTSVSVGPVEDVGERPEVDPSVGLLELPRGVAMLVVQRGSDDSVRFPLEAPIVQAGRHPESDIFLDDITVSRRHAEFVTRDKVTTVRDVGSLNGTYVNRARIEEARLSSGDEVQIGKFKLLYLLAGGE
jgi:pSer/pThr/pTyr-binding forkhead associated (FHA) protein